jgi:hypothetical protein
MLEEDDQRLDAKAPFRGDSFAVSQVHQCSALTRRVGFNFPLQAVVAVAVYLFTITLHIISCTIYHLIHTFTPLRAVDSSGIASTSF